MHYSNQRAKDAATTACSWMLKGALLDVSQVNLPLQLKTRMHCFNNVETSLFFVDTSSSWTGGRVVYFHLFSLLYKHNLITFLSSWRHRQYTWLLSLLSPSCVPSFDIIYALFSFLMKISVVTRLLRCDAALTVCQHCNYTIISSVIIVFLITIWFWSDTSLEYRKMDDSSDYPSTTLISIYVKCSKDSTRNLHIFSAFDN